MQHAPFIAESKHTHTVIPSYSYHNCVCSDYHVWSLQVFLKQMNTQTNCQHEIIHNKKISTVYCHTERSLTYKRHPPGNLQGFLFGCLNSILMRCFEKPLVKRFFEPGWYHLEP